MEKELELFNESKEHCRWFKEGKCNVPKRLNPPLSCDFEDCPKRTKTHWNDYLKTEIKPYWPTLYNFLKEFQFLGEGELNPMVNDTIEERIGRIYVRWCKKEITGDDAMHQIYGLFREACNRVWRQDQNIGKGKPGRKPRR